MLENLHYDRVEKNDFKDDFTTIEKGGIMLACFQSGSDRCTGNDVTAASANRAT